MGLSVRIAGPVDAVGGGRFLLRGSAGRVALPQLEVAPTGDGPPPRLLSLRSTVLSPPGALADAVHDSWTATDLERSLVAAPIRSAPCPPVHVPAGLTADAVVSVRWTGRYVIEPNPPEEFEFIVDLQFPRESATENPLVPPHPGLVAIDFGTSNSTVVLFDADKHYTRPLGRRQLARLRDGLVDLITDPSLPTESDGQFTDLLSRVASRAGLGSEDPAKLLTAALRELPVGNPRAEPALLYTVLLGIERELQTRAQPLLSWLAIRLHRCYEAAFAIPGLDGLQLFPVELDPVAGSLELPSRIEVTDVDPLQVVLSVDDNKLTAPAAGEARTIHIGLKQHLGKPESRIVTAGGSTAVVTTDELIQEGLGYLVARSDHFIEQNPSLLARGRLNHAVITYPTIAPPSVRRELRALLLSRLGAGGPVQVDASYDEAIAAVMFFLMRDIGGEYEVGIEAIKTRYQQLTPTAWAQNILVVDIGGGTTDIALVTMTLTDRTVPEPGVEPQWCGRYYVLTPQVRGSTGNLQLGGEYLTLKVFHWLKAAVADHLLGHVPADHSQDIQALPETLRDGAGGYQPGSLVAAMLADDENPVVLDIVEGIVPTRWKQTPANEQAFWLLWQLADRAKLALGAPDADPFLISSAELRQVVSATAAATESTAPQLPDEGVVLAAETFSALVKGPLAEVMELATSLVAGRFRTDPAARLHRVILTGKTTGLDQVRRALDTGFGTGLNWDPTGVSVEGEYAKLATAIGACWAESVRQFAFNPEGARRQMREGKTVLDVEVDNLFFNLPCTFALREETGYAARIPVGQELFQLDADDIGKARSDDRWEDQLSETVTVYRVVDEKNKKGEIWGSFKYREHLGPHESAGLDPAIWPGEIRTQLEVTQDLDLSIHLCRGRPDLVIGGPTVDVLDAIRDVFDETYLDPDGMLPESLPGDIMVDSLIAGSTTRSEHVVFSGGTPLMLNETFYDGDDPTAEQTPGVVAERDLEPPARRRSDGPDGSWVFTLRFGGGEKEIGRLPRPTIGGSRFPTRYRATLDRLGRLRVHAGALPYRQATTLKEVEERGRVFTQPIPPARPTHDEKRDPFNGTH